MHAGEEHAVFLLEAILIRGGVSWFWAAKLRRRARQTLASTSLSISTVRSGCKLPQTTRCMVKTTSLPSPRPPP